jgi:hypothetical protein
MKLKRLTEIMEINGVRVYAHWSVLVIGALILLGAIERPVETIAAWSAYFGVILIHECGHMIAAQRKRVRGFLDRVISNSRVRSISISVVALRRGFHRVGRSGGPSGGSLATRDIREHLWFYPLRCTERSGWNPGLL